MPKRVGFLYEKVISPVNLKLAIQTVCNTHRWIHFPDKPNLVVKDIEENIDSYLSELQEIIENGFKSSEVTPKRRYDRNAKKWRDICEPKIFPDQCIHHALVQVLEPIMMRGMDTCVCGSIKKRGAHYGIKKIKKYMKHKKTCRWCLEADIYHFYDSIQPEFILERFRQLIKDEKVIDLIEGIICDGVKIGFYTSQWFANTFLQPLDKAIRDEGMNMYVRYMDNFTIFAQSKTELRDTLKVIKNWLEEHGLKIKGNWQIFKVTDERKKRKPNALGYRYGRNYCILRKHSFHSLKTFLAKYYRMKEEGVLIPVKFAQGMISRIGSLKWCNHYMLYSEGIIKKGTLKEFKDIIREYTRKENEKWNMYLAEMKAA